MLLFESTESDSLIDMAWHIYAPAAAAERASRSFRASVALASLPRSSRFAALCSSEMARASSRSASADQPIRPPAPGDQPERAALPAAAGGVLHGAPAQSQVGPAGSAWRSLITAEDQ